MTEEEDREERADEILLRYFEALGRGEEPDIDALLAGAEDLRGLVLQRLADWDRNQPHLASAAALLEELGPSPTAPGSPPGGWDEFLSRLAERVPISLRYERVGEVGRGGMGIVEKIRDPDLDRTLARKVIAPRGERSEWTVTPTHRLLVRFLHEARITARLDHPGIVPVHELGLDAEGRVYFTMKLVEGGDLGKILDILHDGREDWTLFRAVGVIQKVCDTMAFAHSKGVVHRDLKPRNVMVGEFGEVYVMDWGLARDSTLADGGYGRVDLPVPGGSSPEDLPEGRRAGSDSPLLTIQGQTIGTPAYMPPEQAHGQVDRIGPRSDVYSLGAILYHLLARAPPYSEPDRELSQEEVLARVKAGSPRPLHEVGGDHPAELVSICEQAMSREIEERYGSAVELAEDLRAFLEGRVVRAYETGAWAEAKKWVRRNKPLAASLTAGVLALVAGLVLSLSFKQKADENAKLAEQRRIESDKNARLAENRRVIADQREQIAKALEALAKKEKSNVFRLSAFQTLDDLTKEADDLWPADPGMVDRYRAWLKKAETLVASIPEHREQLLELERRLLSLVSETREAEEIRWWHAQMQKLVAALSAFGNEATGLAHGISPEHGWGIAKRLEFATSIEERSVIEFEAARCWSEAIASIGDCSQCPKYDGLAITLQIGLFPIGRDANSGLWEFAHLQSGEPAVRTENGKLLLKEDTGLVLVLLPGGTFLMGSQATDPTADGYDPMARDNEQPVFTVTLAPLFISKYEMTQGQWERCTGQNPSYSRFDTSRAYSRLHPVENVSWEECSKTLLHLGLSLPSEAEWEYAARGGTSTRWWTGDEKESLMGAVNIADQTAFSLGVTQVGVQDWPELEDGWGLHAPVGTFRANPFGLHDVMGNVGEWCLDAHYAFETAGRGGEDLDARVGICVFRGGSCLDTALETRPACRTADLPTFRYGFVGLRPALRAKEG